MVRFFKKHRNVIQYLLIAVVTFLYFSFFINKGITLYDEGYIVESSYLTYLGKLPYKDFYFQYTPLTVWIGAFLFKVFGTGILSLRWFALFVSLMVVMIGHEIARRLTNMNVALLVAFGLAVWGFPHANFLWPSSLSLLFLFIGIFFFLNYQQTGKARFLAMAGASVALNVLSKQNLGAMNLLTSFIFILLISRRFLTKSLMYFCASLFLILVLSFLLIFLNNPELIGLGESISRSLALARGQAFFSAYPLFGGFPTSLSEGIKWAVKSYLYVSPIIIIFLLGLRLHWKGDMKPINIGVFIMAALHFLTVVWPTADLAHFSFGVPTILIVFLIGLLSRSLLIRRFAYFSIIIFIFIGLYKTFFMSYYTFETPYLKLRDVIYIKEEKIVVDQKYKVIVETLNKEKNGLFRNKKIFVYSYAPMIYFILEKDPPVYDLYTVENLLSDTSISKTINSLEQSRVDVILLESWRESNSEITRYIRKNFKKTGEIWDFEVLERI